MRLPIACLFFFAQLAAAEAEPSGIGRAADILRAAAGALGGEDRLLSLESVRYGYEGSIAMAYQGRAAGSPQPFEYRHDVQATFQPLRLRTATVLGGAAETSFENVRYLDGSRSAALRELARELRASPHAIVKHLIENPRDARVIGETPGQSRVAARFHGELLELHFDRSDGLLRRVVRVFDDVRRGDAQAVLEFPAYREQGGWRLPTRLRLTEAGLVVIDLPLATYELGAVNPAQVVAPERDDAPDPAATPAGAAPPTGDLALAEGVTLLRNSGGFDYHSLLVETNDGAILVEAPGTADDGRSLRERARRATTAPIRYLAATHHHGDHSGGVAGAAFDGLRVVVAESEAGFFRDMLSAPRSFTRREFEPARDATIETVPPGGERRLLDSVIAIDAGPSGHSNAHLVYYAPASGVLFQSDMAVFRWDGTVEPARAQTCRLRHFIRERGLAVRVLAGGHGRPGTLEDLERAVALREGGCPDASEAR